MMHAEFKQWTQQKGIDVHSHSQTESEGQEGRDERTSRNSSSGEALVADA